MRARLLLLLLVLVAPAFAQTTTTAVTTSSTSTSTSTLRVDKNGITRPPPRENFTPDGTEHVKGATWYDQTRCTTLAKDQDGTILNCIDCLENSDPAQCGGTGCLVERANGRWKCISADEPCPNAPCGPHEVPVGLNLDCTPVCLALCPAVGTACTTDADCCHPDACVDGVCRSWNCCIPNPCLNGGTCVLSGSPCFACLCPCGYCGDACEGLCPGVTTTTSTTMTPTTTTSTTTTLAAFVLASFVQDSIQSLNGTNYMALGYNAGVDIALDKVVSRTVADMTLTSWTVRLERTLTVTETALFRLVIDGVPDGTMTIALGSGDQSGEASGSLAIPADSEVAFEGVTGGTLSSIIVHGAMFAFTSGRFVTVGSDTASVAHHLPPVGYRSTDGTTFTDVFNPPPVLVNPMDADLSFTDAAARIGAVLGSNFTFQPQVGGMNTGAALTVPAGMLSAAGPVAFSASRPVVVGDLDTRKMTYSVTAGAVAHRILSGYAFASPRQLWSLLASGFSASQNLGGSSGNSDAYQGLGTTSTILTGESGTQLRWPTLSGIFRHFLAVRITNNPGLTPADFRYRLRVNGATALEMDELGAATNPGLNIDDAQTVHVNGGELVNFASRCDGPYGPSNQTRVYYAIGFLPDVVVGSTTTMGPTTTTTTTTTISTTTTTLPPLACSTLTQNKSVSVNTIYSTAPVGGSSMALRIVWVASRTNGGGGANAAPAVAGNGSTWSQISTAVDFPTGYRLTAFRAMDPAPVTTAITFTFAANQRSVYWAVVECVGVRRTGINGADAVRNENADGGNASAGLIAMASFLDPADGTIAGWFPATSSATPVTPGIGFTELAEQGSTSEVADLEVEWVNANESGPSASFGSIVDYSGFAFELVAIP